MIDYIFGRFIYVMEYYSEHIFTLTLFSKMRLDSEMQ